MLLSSLITSIKQEVPVDWSKRVPYFEELEKIEQSLTLRAEIQSSAKDQLVNAMVQFIGVPTFDWQQRIANLINNANDITIPR